ncbi:MAG: Na+/H+ antiporter NhaA [Planctomycetia bacterium]|nr:Na+/H+ antiporter NhaA [Planctomycetia bacterium]
MHADPAAVALPREPIHAVTTPLARFLHIETASGIVLLIATAAALALANSPYAPAYRTFWDTPVVLTIGAVHLSHTMQEWINDGVMVIFFFVIGLEVKRELVLGELRDVRRATLPLAAALGGMLAPAGIYLALQHGQPGERGWGIPMATDIAFVVGCMALLGPRVPHGLRIMLLSLAIADDIGAILVIAVGYTADLHFDALGVGLGLMAAVAACARLGVRSILVYSVLGFAVWLAFLKSGVHATIAGVILGLLTPSRRYLGTETVDQFLERARQLFQGDWDNQAHRAMHVRKLQWAMREAISPLEYLEQTMHPWVGFAIMPLFALANAGVPVQVGALGAPISVAVILGLMLGKPLGIVLFSWLAVRCNLAKLPTGVDWRVMVGAGCLAGIGFTMALFIADLALDDEQLVTAKIGILAGSTVSAALGLGLLLLTLPKPPTGGATVRAADPTVIS